MANKLNNPIFISRQSYNTNSNLRFLHRFPVLFSRGISRQVLGSRSLDWMSTKKQGGPRADRYTWSYWAFMTGLIKGFNWGYFTLLIGVIIFESKLSNHQKMRLWIASKQFKLKLAISQKLPWFSTPLHQKNTMLCFFHQTMSLVFQHSSQVEARHLEEDHPGNAPQHC